MKVKPFSIAGNILFLSSKKYIFQTGGTDPFKNKKAQQNQTPKGGPILLGFSCDAIAAGGGRQS